MQNACSSLSEKQRRSRHYRIYHQIKDTGIRAAQEFGEGNDHFRMLSQKKF